MDYTVKKISEFPENEYPLTGDCILVEHNPAADGTAKKMTLTQLLQFMNIKSEAHPAGTMYIQFKGGKTPSELFGGTWYNVSSEFAGMFFRAEGGNAAAFGSDQEQSVQAHTHTINHTHTRGSMEITGRIVTQGTEDKYSSASGAFSIEKSVTGYGGGHNGDSESPAFNFTASDGWTGSTSTPSATNSGSYGGTETRPVNSTIRIWRRAY